MTDDRFTLDRRGFALGAGGLALGALAGGAARAALAPEPAISPAVRALYDKAIVIDALASPDTWNVPFPPPGEMTQQKLDNVRASGITAINLTVGKPGNLANTLHEIAAWLQHIDDHPDYFRLVKRHSDIAAAKAEKKLGIIFGFQGMGMIGEDLSLIDMFDGLWVKIMQLTYNDRNALGAGSSLPESEGLTPLGREAVARMNARGILVDTGHANPKTALDAVAASTRPITCSHTGSRAVFPSQRNQPDTVLRAVAEKGGVVGIYLMPFLGRDPVSASRALFVRHLRHALDICGEDHVGIGSDQSITPVDISPAYMDIVRKTAEARQKAGIGAPGEADSPVAVPDLNSARRMEIIAAEMDRAKYPPRVIEKVLGGNFDRLFREVWPA
ncbi:membrane dipeptidase [Rhizorhabdus wittichii]|uniref:Membrane dipeptidase n=1 Tax=Rhizorhabdus wittichii TaxID=160791 RepID=A0A975D6P6_9SPHN|nr:membrane dipeptidase [Rhizorhabdus wittichii]QTH23276.1 membrane dipeptidase [Rhizorhabdus wittichii]